MNSKRDKHFLICLAGGLMVSAAPAISYREWAAAPPPGAAPISVVLEPLSNGWVKATQRIEAAERGRGHDRSAQIPYDVPSRPSGGYLGQIVIRQHDGARLDFPLTVSISFPGVDVEDLLPLAGHNHAITAAGSNLSWHLPMGLLNPGATVRPERFRRSWSIARLPTADRVTSVPLILTRVKAGRYQSGGSDNLCSCLCEVRDARGTVLLRKQVVELFCPASGYAGGGTAWVMNEPEADRFLRESAGVNNAYTIGALPPLIEPYAEIDALWISGEADRSAAMTPAMARRLLLMGTWIYGRNATISNLTAMAGLAGPGSVLLGGIQAVALPLPQNSDAKARPSHNSEDALWDNNYDSIDGNTNALPVMENRRDLFEPLKGWYLGWTIGVLGVFFGAACIGLPVAFWRLKSSRRLALWWLIPLVAIAVGGVSLVGGQWLLPRQPQADLTEYRFAVAGWPEVFCRSVNRSLTFEERRVSWTLPGDSFIVPARSRSNPAGPEWLDETPGGVVRGISGLKRGQIVIDETACFRSAPLPVAVDESTTNRPGLKVLDPLRHLHVWENGSWHRVGDVKSGQLIPAPFGARTNALFGLPRRVSEAFPSYDVVAPGLCKNCGKVHEATKNLSTAFGNTWIVAALSDEPAATRPVMKNTRTESRVVWLIQIPMHPQNPSPGAIGGNSR